MDELVRTYNIAVGSVRRRIGLKLADHKADVLFIISRKRMKYITIAVRDQYITSKQAIKYMGVMIDKRLTFRENLTYIGGKCAATLFAFARIMPNLGGPYKKGRLKR